MQLKLLGIVVLIATDLKDISHERISSLNNSGRLKVTYFLVGGIIPLCFREELG